MRVEGRKQRSTVWLIPSLGGGGAERTVVNLTAAFEKRGIDCVIGVQQANKSYETAVPVESLAPFGVSRLELWPWLAPRRLRQLELSRGADSTISFTTFANLLNSRGGGSSHPRYLSVRTTLSRALYGPSGGAYRALLRRYYPRATKIIAISKFVADDTASLLGIEPGQIQTIYNPVPIAEIDDLAGAGLPPPWDTEFENRFTIATVGRLSAEKGHALLLRVVASMHALGLDCRLVMAGQGARLEDYARLADTLGLRVARASDPIARQRAADVLFLGFVRNPFALMRAAHAFAFPSALEGFGQALLEAVASGATIVASDCDAGPREILAPNTNYRRRSKLVEETDCGWLAPPPSTDWRVSSSDTIAAWVEALQQIYADRPDKRIACRRRAQDFGIDAVADAWTNTLGYR